MINPTLIVVFVYAVVLPVGLFIWWKKKSGAKTWCFLAGAVCFFVFAGILESELHQFCIGMDNSLSRTINGSPVLYMLYGSFAAGIFEETARLFGFKLLLRDEYKKETAVAYGIGHGGFEVLFLLGTTYLVYILASCGVSMGTSEVTEQIVGLANSIEFGRACLAMFERISAMLVHIGLSMIMFAACRGKGKMWLYPVAICLHAMVDMPSALFQKAVITSLPGLEAGTLVLALAVFFIGKRLLDANAEAIEIEGDEVVRRKDAERAERMRAAKKPAEKHIKIRKLEDEEKQAALDLSWEVFQQFEAPEYSEEGILEFRKSLDDKERTDSMTFYGAFDGDDLVGTLCMREPQHIGDFFVKADCQGKGIGRHLFDAMKKDYGNQEFTVNSSPYALEIYKKLGFIPTDSEQTVNGIRFTPMIFKSDRSDEREQTV